MAPAPGVARSTVTDSKVVIAPPVRHGGKDAVPDANGRPSRFIADVIDPAGGRSTVRRLPYTRHRPAGSNGTGGARMIPKY